MPLCDFKSQHGSDTHAFTGGRLGAALPQLLLDNRAELMLEPDTPYEGIQVTFDRFGPDDINTPELWLYVKFTESLEPERERLGVRDKFDTLIHMWFKHNCPAGFWPSLAVDLDWNTGRHGFMRDQYGKITHRW